MNELENRITEAFKGNKQFDEDVRNAMHRALQLDEHKSKEDPASQAHMALGLLALEVAVSLANAFAGLRRPNEARYVRLFFDGTAASSSVSWSKPIAKMLYDPGMNLLGLSSPGAIP